MSIISLSSHVEKKPALDYSTYQTDIFEAISNTTDNLIVEAVAGSGKTTTIIHALDLLPARASSIFLAFNKSIADELAMKVPPNVSARTLHSLGYEILRNNYKRVKSNGKFVLNTLKFEVLDIKKNPQYKDWAWENGRDVCTLISRMKGAVETLPHAGEFIHIAESLDLDIPMDKFAISVVLKTWELCNVFDGVKKVTIDFDDMIYLPATQDLDFPQYDYVILDESQDLNKMQREFVAKILAPTGRLIAVGDTKQSIYGFRGADHNSMGAIKREFGCTELPLSISYRCDRAIVNHARRFVPEIEARPHAQEGIVSSVDYSDVRFMLAVGDHVLCRTNAPLVKLALTLGTRGNNVCVLGNDVVPGLMKIAKQIDKSYDGISNNYINDYYNLMVCGFKEGQEWKAYALSDKCKTLQYIVAQDTMTSREVAGVLAEIFTDKPPITPHITLSTIHKAKGLEADRIFILKPNLLPHPMAKGHNELIQEENLHYVAVTRAKHELYYITEGAE